MPNSEDRRRRAQYRVRIEYSDDVVQGRHVVVVREWAEIAGYFAGTAHDEHFMIWVPSLHNFRGSGWTREEALREAARLLIDNPAPPTSR